MPAETKNRWETRAVVIKAMAHPSRLRIVEELGKGERCVCELTTLIGTDMSTVSKHLALLKQAGLVDTDKRGNQVFYSLRCPCVLQFLDCVERVLRESQRLALDAK